MSQIITKSYGIWSMRCTDLRRQRLHSNTTGQLMQNYVDQYSTTLSIMQLATLYNTSEIMVVL